MSKLETNPKPEVQMRKTKSRLPYPPLGFAAIVCAVSFTAAVPALRGEGTGKAGPQPWSPERPPKAHYRIDAEIDAEAGTVRGRQTVVFTNNSAEAIQALAILWHETITVCMEDTPPVRVEPWSACALAKPAAPGGLVRLTVEFTGAYKRRHWYPRVDWVGVPAFDSYEVKLKVPAGYAVATSGRLNERTGCYECSGARDFGLSLHKGLKTEKREVDGVLITAFFSEKDAECARFCLESAVDVVRFYKSWLGFYPTKSLCILPGASRPMGGYPFAPGIVVIHGQEQFASKPPLHWQWITAHEIGHQYWGEWVLAEPIPFHSYFNWLMIGMGVHADREYVRARGLGLDKHEAMLNRYRDGVRSRHDTTMEGRTTPPAFDFNNVVIHGKGFATVSALANLLGKQAFARVYERCLKEFAGRPMSSRDLQALCEQDSGRDLGWFFEAWVQSDSFLSYEVASRDCVKQGDGYETTLRVKCLGTLRMPMPVEARFIDGTAQRKTTERDADESTLRFRSASYLREAVIDPDKELAMIVPPPRKMRKMETIPLDDLGEVPPGTCGVLFVTRDDKTGSPDLFLADPTARIRVNLTRGRSDPWGPVGSPDGRSAYFSARGGGRVLDLDGLVLRRLPDGRGRPSSLRWSPDGKSFALAEDGKLFVGDRETLEMNPVADWEGASVFDYPRFSPDGKWIACEGKSGIRLVSPDGQQEKVIPCKEKGLSDICWGPAGKSLAAVHDGRLVVVNATGGRLDRHGEASTVDDWSPDGKLIAYETRAGGPRKIRILSVADKRSYPVDAPGDCHSGVWSPDGKLLAFWSRGKLMVVGTDGKNPQVLGNSLDGSCMGPSWLDVPVGDGR